MINKGIFD